MTCKCKDDNGFSTLTCHGACINTEDFKQGLAVDQMVSIREMFRSHIASIDKSIADIKEMSLEFYARGYKDGFDMGRDIYE